MRGGKQVDATSNDILLKWIGKTACCRSVTRENFAGGALVVRFHHRNA
jgi:hypothetical protein